MPRCVKILISLLILGLILPAGAAQILLIDDSPAEGFRSAKDSDARAWGLDAKRSTLELQADLESMGHTVNVVSAEMADPGVWPSVDMLIWSSADHPLPLGNPAWRAMLRHFVNGGGHLLIEGGDIAFHWIEGDPLFAESVLHGHAWLSDPIGFMNLFEYEHPLSMVPNSLPVSFSPEILSYTDVDAVRPSPGSFMFYRWSDGPVSGGLLGYDPDPLPDGGQILYFPFRYSALDPDDRLLLLENSVTWLTTLDAGDASIAGVVELMGEDDQSGVQVQLQPGGLWVETTEDGSFLLDGIVGGQHYNISASKDGFVTTSIDREIAPGESIDGLIFSMPLVFQVTSCSEPSLSIPDDDPMGITDSITMEDLGFVENLEVFVDISHTWIGDLVVSLESAENTIGLLHFRSGSNLNELYGWYPLELAPVQNLDRFLNEPTEGPWTLHVADVAGADLGTLNAWCLRISANDGTDVEETVSSPIAKLRPNWPNPFNPNTAFSFSLDRDCYVNLNLVDPSGRKIRELCANPLPAGEHQMEWDGRDTLGRSLPSGLYILRLETAGQIQTRKLMLLN